MRICAYIIKIYNENCPFLAIPLTSILIGSVHLYQGLAGIIGIGIKSVIFCIYYYKHRRIFPLIISHVLYGGLQFAYLVMQLR